MNGEEEVLPDVAHGGVAEPARPDDAGEVAPEQRDAGTFDGDVRASPHGDADVGSREGRRVVDAVARHRDDTASFLRR